MSEIRNLTRNGETFYPLTHEKAVIGMEDFKDTITEQIDNYRPIEITGDVTNAPDEEDITSDSNNLLKFKNRNNLYGLGKVILRRGSSFASQVTQANTIYVIQYNFDLGGARINIPNGSILLFEGGTLSNGTLVCADLYDVRLVYYQDISVILNSVTLEGNFIYKACDKDTIGGISVDNSSIEMNSSNQLTVKASGIQNTHLNGSVVDNSSISLDTNNKISIKDGGVTGNKLNSGIVNTDDLSIINNKIQLANRGTSDGMGKIILRKDQSFASQLTQTNTIYVIRYDFTLTGDVTIPTNCILDFQGGSLSGAYTITGNNTGIKATLVKIFNTDITLAGSWIVTEAYPEWFGAKGDGVTDSTVSLQKCITFCESKPFQLKLNGTYIISDTLNISSIYLDGNKGGINYSGNSIAVQLTGNHFRMVLENFVLSTSTGTYGIKGDKSLNKSIIRNIQIYGFSNTGLYLTNSYLCNLENLGIENCGVGLHLTEAYCSKLHNIDSVRNNINVEIAGIDITFDGGDVSYAGSIGISSIEMTGCAFRNIYYEGNTNNVSVFKTHDDIDQRSISFEDIYISTTASGVKCFDFSSDKYNCGHVFNGIKTNVEDDTIIFALSEYPFNYPRSYSITLLNDVVQYNDKGIMFSGNGYINIFGRSYRGTGAPVRELSVNNGNANIIGITSNKLQGNGCSTITQMINGNGSTHGVVDYNRNIIAFVNVITNKGTAKYFISGDTSTMPVLIVTDNPNIFNDTSVRWSGNYTSDWTLILPSTFSANDYALMEYTYKDNS